MLTSKNFQKFYFQLAETRFEKYSGEAGIFNFYSDLLFWQNFGLNFKDPTYVHLIKQNEEITEKVKIIIKSLENLFIEFYKYDELISKEGSSSELNRSFLTYILSIIVDILNNYSTCLYVPPSEKFNFEEVINKQVKKIGVRVDLIKNFLDNYYSKIGYSYLNFKGEFLWADTYTQMLFECDSLLRKNLYSLITPYSEFILRSKFGNSIFNSNEQKNSEIIKFSIMINQVVNKDKDFTQGGVDFPEQIFNYLNSTKCLTARISKVILMSNSTVDEGNNVVILLQTRISRKRQNFDEFSYFNFYKNFDN